jgi:DNA primase
MNDIYTQAKEAVALPELWRRYGLPIKPAPGAKRERYITNYTPCCGEHSRPDAGSIFKSEDTGLWRYKCFPCKQGGTAVDLVAKMDGVNHHAAARKLLEQGGGYQQVKARMAQKPKQEAPSVSSIQRQEALVEVAKIILASDVRDPDTMRYLTETRMISPATVNEAMERGVLRVLPFDPNQCNTWLKLNVGTELLEKTGLLAPKKRWPAAAFRPVVFLPPDRKCMEFRVASEQYMDPKALQYGDKSMPIVWRPSSGIVRKVLIVEGGINLMSTVDLGLADDTLILGPLGTSAWKDEWIEPIRSRYPRAEWLIGFDPDKAGETVTPLLMKTLADSGIPARRVLPIGCNAQTDWNDSLKAAAAF